MLHTELTTVTPLFGNKSVLDLLYDYSLGISAKKQVALPTVSDRENLICPKLRNILILAKDDAIIKVSVFHGNSSPTPWSYWKHFFMMENVKMSKFGFWFL